MKVITTTTTKLSDHDFNVLTEKIVNAIYDIEPEIADVYEKVDRKLMDFSSLNECR